MAPTGVAVHCYWNGRVVKEKGCKKEGKLDLNVVYSGDKVNVMPMKLNYGISYGELLEKIYAITSIDKHKFELDIICRYPTSSHQYKPIPITNDEAVQVMLEVPSRSSTIYCVQMFLEKRTYVGRKWEDLDMKCLAKIFQKVELESLLLNVPFVCKSWYKASLNPNCWKNIIFHKNMWANKILKRYGGSREGGLNDQIATTALVKFVVNRSHGSATTLQLPEDYTEKALEYAANKCPSLKSLAVPFRPHFYLHTLNPRLISKFRNLESLTIQHIKNTKDILYQISIYCNHLIKLSAPGLHFLKDEASIITLLPKIRYLVLWKANFVKRENVLMILDGCRELIHFDVRYCIGFDEDDIEILRLASYIPEFICEGSTCSRQDFNANAYDFNPGNIE